MLELNLDRYPSKAAMLGFVEDMLNTLDSRQSAIWPGAYTEALQQAFNAVHDFETPAEAVASLHGCQRLEADRANRMIVR